MHINYGIKVSVLIISINDVKKKLKLNELVVIWSMMIRKYTIELVD